MLHIIKPPFILNHLPTDADVRRATRSMIYLLKLSAQPTQSMIFTGLMLGKFTTSPRHLWVQLESQSPSISSQLVDLLTLLLDVFVLGFHIVRNALIFRADMLNK